MIDALVAGHLVDKAVLRTAKTGNTYATFRLRATCRSGESVQVSGITFSATMAALLAELDPGDAVAMTGELSLSGYLAKDGTPRPGVDLVAHTITTDYHTARKRKAARPASDGAASAAAPTTTSPAPAGAPPEDDFDDSAIPF